MDPMQSIEYDTETKQFRINGQLRENSNIIANCNILVCYDAAYIFHALLDTESSDDVFELVDTNRLRDVKIMDALLDIAIGSGSNVTYRTQNEICGDRDLVDVYKSQQKQAYEIVVPHLSEITPGGINKFGYLTEFIQVKGSIVMRTITRNGMALDVSRFNSLRTTVNAKYSKYYKKLRSSGIFVDSHINEKHLNNVLDKCISEIKNNHNIVVDVPHTKDGLAKNHFYWNKYSQYHPFVKNWMKMKRFQYYKNILNNITPIETQVESRVYPKYVDLTANGRTSSYEPPIQQFPTKPGYREIFKASRGHKYFIIDYDYIELCTLAYVCQQRYGFSRLGDTIRNNIDPHSYTASMLLGVDYDTYIKTKDQPKEKKYRIISKIVNFGITGGQSVNGLIKFAQRNYDIKLNRDETVEFHRKFIKEIYPELSLYLRDTSLQNATKSLNIPMHSFNKHGLISAFRGSVANKRIWDIMINICQNPELKQVLIDAEYQNSPELFNRIFGTQMTTVTGRVRNNVGYTAMCNTARCGVAADGAKLAMWNLMYSGYKIVAFIHDEIIVEVPEDELSEATEIIPEIFCKSMENIIGNIPVHAKYQITDCWTK